MFACIINNWLKNMPKMRQTISGSIENNINWKYKRLLWMFNEWFWISDVVEMLFWVISCKLLAYLHPAWRSDGVGSFTVCTVTITDRNDSQNYQDKSLVDVWNNAIIRTVIQRDHRFVFPRSGNWSSLLHLRNIQQILQVHTGTLAFIYWPVTALMGRF